MTFRLNVSGGRLDVISGEIPPDLLEACRELAAEYPDCQGKIVLREGQGRPGSVTFHGTFPRGFQQRLRNLWALKARGQKLPQRLRTPAPLFRVSVSGGAARAVLRAPPPSVMDFCASYARANRTAVVTVTGLLDGDEVRLEVTGDMPEAARRELRRRWEREPVAVPPSPARPGSTERGGGRKRIGGRWWIWAALAAVVLLGLLLAVAGSPRLR